MDALCMTKYHGRQLSHQCLSVGMSLTREHATASLQPFIKAIVTKHKLGSRLRLGIHEFHKGIAQPAGRSGPRLMTAITLLMTGGCLGKCRSLTLQQVHHLRCGPLLRGKDTRCATIAKQRSRHVSR